MITIFYFTSSYKMWKPNIQLNDTIFIKFKGFKAFDSFNEKNRAAFVLIFFINPVFC